MGGALQEAQASVGPLTRDASVGHAPDTIPERGERAGLSVATREKKLRGWATIRSVRGVRSIRRSCSWIESVAEVDRRRVAPRDLGRRAQGTDGGSSFPMREHRGSERAPEAEPRWLSREIGGGFPQNIEPCESRPRGHLSMEGALNPESRWR